MKKGKPFMPLLEWLDLSMKISFLLIIFTLNLHGEPWIDAEDYQEIENIEREFRICSTNGLSLSKSFPASYGEILKNFNEIYSTSSNEEAKKHIKNLKKRLPIISIKN